MKPNLPFLLILFFTAFTNNTKAQIVTVRTVVPAACSDTLIGTTIWACTIGEPVIETATTGSNIFTQGFNQPDGYSISLSQPYIQDLVIYPNPAYRNATVKFYLKADKPELSIEIYDATGKLYQNQKLQSFAGQTWHSLNPQVMAAGTYMVRVTDGYDVYAGKLVIIN